MTKTRGWRLDARLALLGAFVGGVVSLACNAGAQERELTFAEVEQIALSAVPGGRVTDVEREGSRPPTYEVEVREPSGRERELVIHAVTGEILIDRYDD